ISSIARMPVDLFPSINIPVVVVATFYSGMPPEEMEMDITGPFERFFTLGSGIDHIESRSLPGVSLVKVYFQPGTDADSDQSEIANLAMAQLRRLPPGTLPPVVLKFDASSLPVCLVTLKGQGLDETHLRDLGQFNVRNQIAGVPGSSVPQPFGGKYRQIMVYVDPVKLEAHQLSVMDVVQQVNQSNLILPAGDVKIGPYDYNLYTNAQVPDVKQLDSVPLKTVGESPVLVADVGKAQDANAIQTNIVRVDGQRSVYLPILKQGGDTNTIAIVNGIRDRISHLLDIPKELVTNLVFDQSEFVKNAIDNLFHEGATGLILTGLMILLFLGNARATVAVFLSIPLAVMFAFVLLNQTGNTINTMVLGGFALAFSRLIDDSVIVLENIFRHMEMGEAPAIAAEKGGMEVALPVLAVTLSTIVVFFPVTFFYGVSRYLFTALALAVAFSLFGSYLQAMTVVPLFCSKFIKVHVSHEHGGAAEPGARMSWGARFNAAFNRKFTKMLDGYERLLRLGLAHPLLTVAGIFGIFLLSLTLYPLVGQSFFPRTDAGQFVINVKAPSGTRVEGTEQEIKRVEDIVRDTVSPEDMGLIVSNIGITPDFSAIYTSNSGPHTAFVQVSLKPEHKVSSFEYMARVRKRLESELPLLNTYFQSGGLADAVLNMGAPAPIDIQVGGNNLDDAYKTATEIATKTRALGGVSDILIPQDIDYPAFQMNIDRGRASELGLSEKEVVDNVITALTSNGMIAPSYWIDPKNGNDYMLTVQYPETQVKTVTDLKGIPIRSADHTRTALLDQVVKLNRIVSPTEVDHYQLRRVIDVYVSPQGEDLSRLANGIDKINAGLEKPANVTVDLHGMVLGMRASFKSFVIGLSLAIILVYLILVAQFRSFIDPFLILLAVPTGLTGVLVILLLTNTTLNVMSLMGVVMMVGMVVSNSILIVEFSHRLWESEMQLKDAVAMACRVRLRPILMTSLATLIGLVPMALGLGAGSESYAPLARSIIGGLGVSIVLTVFLVPAGFLVIYGRRDRAPGADGNGPKAGEPMLDEDNGPLAPIPGV
ncbi:MAG TPA: efflux RND transporter permease subunit, partial [Blastocatellia bacterium]